MKIVEGKIEKKVEFKDIPVGGVYRTGSAYYMRISAENLTLKDISKDNCVDLRTGLVYWQGSNDIVLCDAELKVSPKEVQE